MPLYYFVLKDGTRTIPDREGVELIDLYTARTHAVEVARELMRNRELPTATWRIQVCDEDLRPCFDLLFADLDESCGHLMPKFRRSHRSVARSQAAVHDAIALVRGSLETVRETLATADRLIARITMPRARR